MTNLAISASRATVGIQAVPVSVEVHISPGLPGFTIVGLPEAAVKESRDRVRSAIINSQFEFPNRRITVNLAPADLPKTGGGFDLPIALGILAASKQISKKFDFHSHEFIGELALSGQLRSVSGLIPIVSATRQDNKILIISPENMQEARLAGHDHVLVAENLRQVCNYMEGQDTLIKISQSAYCYKPEYDIDWSDIKGQEHAKFALEIAAMGGHSLLLCGSPGSGKTMLAQRFITLLPALSESHALESAAIHSLRGPITSYDKWRQPPYRSPHHTASNVSLVGGGNPPKPGEISLAHRGVLFLDELPEFDRKTLETLRQPLESGSVFISRAAHHVEFPAQFQLIAAMNPCPCGQWGNSEANCVCSPDRIMRYLSKLSAPLLDRIDMFIRVQLVDESLLTKKLKNSSSSSKIIREKVSKMRLLQENRQGCLNARLTAKQCDEFCVLGPEEQKYMGELFNQLKLSMRGFHRLLKVARTIADLNQHNNIKLVDLQQAITFKQTLNISTINRQFL